MTNLKPAFPVFYLAVFAYTVLAMFANYVLGGQPPAVEGVIGDVNQSWMLGLINAYAFMLCIYVVIYYARLEVLEHKPVRSLPTKKWLRFVEFLIRFMLIGVVALKVLSYHALDDLFLFSLVLCALLSAWLIYMKSMEIVDVSNYELAPNLLILALSGWAYYVSEPAVQSQNAVPLLVISIVAGIALISCVIVLAAKFGKEFYGIARDFVTNW